MASFSACQCAFMPAICSVQVGQLLLDGREALLATRRRSPCDSATFSISSWRMRRSTTSISVGIESISMRSLDADSSTRSMALSGRNRPVR